MSLENKSPEKTRLHPRNKNRDRYDLDAIMIAIPELKNYLIPNKSGLMSIDFSNPKAVKLLNKGLLHFYYDIKNWDFPDENLCPPIPGRADYIHNMADLIAENNFGRMPTGDRITCLDLGVGASCIYPIIGVIEYGWRFIGSDIDPKSIASSQEIVNANPTLEGKIECRLQKSPTAIFRGIINQEEKIDVMICNPPFHASMEEARNGTQRKVKKLSGKSVSSPELNFAGNTNELVCKGGEFQFIQNIIKESQTFSENFYWFSTLVSKESNLKGTYKLLEKAGANLINIIPMGTGNKSTRIIAWTFLTKEAQKEWAKTRWKIVA
uniref:23S rRNA (adenine(1618)-N(6))-methyltransferase RlmF n=1 Tax=Flavobacterium sp. TaxID=239 RepID=UPI0040498114